MKPVAQTVLRPPDGNCFAACVASILEVPLDSVPNIAALQGTEEGRDEGWETVQRWLETRGLLLQYVDEDTFTDNDFEHFYLRGYWIATHEHEGVNHATVWKDDTLAWNPYPGQHDICEGRLVMCEWFVAIDPALAARRAEIDAA